MVTYFLELKTYYVKYLNSYNFYRYNHGDRPLTAKMMLRYDIPERAAAALLNAFMYEEGILSDKDMSRVIDRNVIRKWKRSVFEEPIPTKLNSLYFDGKINKTRQYDVSFRNEEHIVIVSEPGNEFLTHVTPENSGSSENVAAAMLSKLDQAEDILHIKVRL